MASTLSDFILKLANSIHSFSIVDALDIILVAVVVYVIIRQLKSSQSIQIIKGLAVIAVLYLAVKLLGMQASKFLFDKVLGDIIIIFAIIFSPELRRGLEGLGKNKWKRFLGGSADDDIDGVIACVCEATKLMSAKKIGSLIIFQRSSLLGDLTGKAVHLDSNVNKDILCSIFYPKAPLHDGAVVIENGRIIAARCIIPLQNKLQIGQGLGTRHRAAVEISHYSDAIAVVTSEERGTISIAVNGKLKTDLTTEQLAAELHECLSTGNPDSGKMKSIFNRGRAQSTEASVSGGSLSIDDIRLPGEEDEATSANQSSGASDIMSIINEGETDDEQE